MNHELLQLLEQISREKNLAKEALVDAVLSAVLSAARKRFGTTENFQARFDEQTGALVLYACKRVVPDDALSDPHTEIGLEEAQRLKPGVAVGDTVEVVHDVGDFGRIAAQTAKQVIIQKVREAERDMVYREYKDREGELVHGIVARVEKEGNIIVDLGKAEALLPRREQSFRETFQRGDRIRAYVVEVKRSTSGPQVILSRMHPGFLMRLFELEVPEIYEGIVEIKAAVRDPSGRAKIAVVSHDKDVDPIGACVGVRGIRVQAVVQELRGEKIDIVQWSSDPVQFVCNALSPAKVSRVYMNADEKTMQVIVPRDQLSLAIGKRGQNVRLAAKLTHWKIDIKSEDDAEAERARLEALRQAELAFQLPRRSSEPPSDTPPLAAEGEPPAGPAAEASRSPSPWDVLPSLPAAEE
ncbi:MAG: transcription termination/antitermination protein NusA [Candidatus Tectimicrobiota bacterium]|nr:MAG: transcription termination/antitermination protein NusA [Candidatus Tectomicrobia bacterium]